MIKMQGQGYHVAGKSIEEWIKIGNFERRGGITVVGGPLFFAVLMPLIIWRLEQDYTIRQKSGVSAIVC